MHQLDIKRFITGFLILAVVAGSVSLIASNLFASRGAPSEQYQQHLKISGQPRPRIDSGAPSEPLPQTANSSAPSGGTIAQGLVSPNLTDNLAAHLADQLIKTNPDGPQQDIDGVTALDSPDIQTVLDQVTLDTLNENVQLPNWEQDAEKEFSNVKVSQKYSTEDLANYVKLLNGVMREKLMDPGLASLSPDNISSVVFGPTRVALAGAVKELKALAVPAPFEAFHKSLIKVLLYENKVVELGDSMGDDPVKAALVFRSHEESYQAALDNFKDQLEKTATQQLSGNKIPGPLAGLQDLVGVNEAHAFLGFGDIVFDPAIFGRTIWEYVQKILVEFLKDQLIHRLVQQVITWVQGGGKPQFLTNWKGFFEDAIKQAASRVISDVAPGLCQSFGPLLKVAFLPTETQDIQTPTACTLDRVVQNIQDFYHDFQTGGWVAYGAAFQPNNNLFGSIIQLHELTVTKQADAKDVASKKTTANRGFTGTQQCIESTIIEVAGEDFETYRKDPNYMETVSCDVDDVSTGGSGELRSCKMRFCTPDGYKDTTPGSVVASQLDQALGSPIHRIVNAQDIAALVNALINAALNKLIGLGKAGIAGLFKSGPGGGGGGPGGGGGGGGAPATTTDPCFGLSPQERIDYGCGPAGGSTGGPADPASKAGLLQVANSTITAAEGAIAADTQWLNLANATKQSLTSAAQACASLADEAQQRITSVNTLQVEIENESERIGIALNRLKNIRDRLQVATSTAALSALGQELNAIGTQEIISAAGEAQDRITRLEALKSAADAATGGDCSAVLPEP